MVECSAGRECVSSDDLDSKRRFNTHSTLGLCGVPWKGIGKLGRLVVLAQIGQHIKQGGISLDNLASL